MTGLGVFSRNPVTRPSPSVGTQPNRAGSSHLDQVQRDRGVGLAVQVELGGEVVAGQDVAVQHHHRAVGAAAKPGAAFRMAAAGTQRVPSCT